MLITEERLLQIIREEILREQEQYLRPPPTWDSYSRLDDKHEMYEEQLAAFIAGTESTHPLANATVLAGRWSAYVPKWMNLKGLGPSPHHSWIILYDERGRASKWFSGKTDKEELPGGLDVAARISFGRQDLEDLEIACTSPSHENAESTMWGALEGLVNANFDNPSTAEIKWLVKIPGVSRVELQNRIESAARLYGGTSPYEFNPAWQMSRLGMSPEDTRCGRNSNSYSHSLLRNAGIRKGSFIPLPGSDSYNPKMFPGARFQIDGVPKR
mgnify:CR=1 FL=1